VINLSGETRKAVKLLYAGAAVILVVEVIEILAMVLPPHGGVASWRFGLFGITVSRMPMFVLADAMFLAAALVLGNRRTLLFAAALHLALAVLVLPAMALYSLDALLLRRAVRPQIRMSFDLTAIRALTVALVGSIFALTMAWLIRRATRAAEPRGAPQHGIVVGAPAERRPNA
jgi:hypothetical protein